MSENKYLITCPTCSAEYHLLDKKCSNCNARNNNVFYEYLTEKNTILDYIKWFLLGLFSLPSILLYIGIAILLGLGYIALAIGINVPILVLIILPFQMIYYAITGEAHFIVDSDIINYIHQIGIENIYLTYLSLFFGIIFALIILGLILGLIFVIISWAVSKFFENKIFNDSEEIFLTSIYLVPLMHSIYRHEEEKNKKIYTVAQWVFKNNLLVKDEYKEDIKLQIYEKFTHKVSKKMDNVSEYTQNIIYLRDFTQKLNHNLSDSEILEEANGEHIIESKFTYYDNLKQFHKQIISALKSKKIDNFYSYTLPWTWKYAYGYGGYFLTKSFFVNLITYGLAIFLWYSIFSYGL